MIENLIRGLQGWRVNRIDQRVNTELSLDGFIEFRSSHAKTVNA